MFSSFFPFPQRLQAGPACMPQHQRGGHASIAYLAPILGVPTARLISRKFFARFCYVALAAQPTAARFVGAYFANATVRVAGFAGHGAEAVFWLNLPTFVTWFLGFAGQADTVEAALPLAMLRRKICFRMPQLAHVALCVPALALSLFSVHSRQTRSRSCRFHWPTVNPSCAFRSLQAEQMRSSRYLASKAAQSMSEPRRCRSNNSRPRPPSF